MYSLLDLELAKKRHDKVLKEYREKYYKATSTRAQRKDKAWLTEKSRLAQEIRRTAREIAIITLTLNRIKGV